MGFLFHLFFSFLVVSVSLAFGGRQNDEHLAQGTSASSKMPIAPPLRNTEKGRELEASVPSEGKVLVWRLVPHCKEREDKKSIAQLDVSHKAQV